MPLTICIGFSGETERLRTKGDMDLVGDVIGLAIDMVKGELGRAVRTVVDRGLQLRTPERKEVGFLIPDND